MILVVFQYFFCSLTFTPKSDQDRISSHGNDVTAYRALRYKYNIKQVGNENKKNINYGIISWSNTKFSELTSWELYGRQ